MSQVLSELKKYGVFIRRHILRARWDARAPEAEYRNDWRRKYISDEINADWDDDLTRTAIKSAGTGDLFQRFFEHGLKITKLADEIGVSLMIGTDANDTMIVPGFSIHDEMALFAKAGVEPMEILRAATTTPAVYLGLTERFGGVSTGKTADLVLLSARSAGRYPKYGLHFRGHISRKSFGPEPDRRIAERGRASRRALGRSRLRPLNDRDKM